MCHLIHTLYLSFYLNNDHILYNICLWFSLASIVTTHSVHCCTWVSITYWTLYYLAAGEVAQFVINECQGCIYWKATSQNLNFLPLFLFVIYLANYEEIHPAIMQKTIIDTNLDLTAKSQLPQPLPLSCTSSLMFIPMTSLLIPDTKNRVHQIWTTGIVFNELSVCPKQH